MGKMDVKTKTKIRIKIKDTPTSIVCEPLKAAEILDMADIMLGNAGHPDVVHSQHTTLQMASSFSSFPCIFFQKSEEVFVRIISFA
ncbi:unnamed protein product [Dovyalis caffra]|uniref:SKP1 component POZ domain-containing protein n=1 Tax=Dovyalis caffra TaxID=77055 RepID=A0AAV1S2G2_9ROSI|nr:unnamed protein product [Dovyalis caffra]